MLELLERGKLFVKQEAHKPESSPKLKFQIAITCVLDLLDDSCMLDVDICIL